MSRKRLIGAPWRDPRRMLFSAAVTALLACGMVQAASGSASAAWVAQDSGVAFRLTGVSCPTVTHCWAVGHNGVIRHTSDGGANWVGQSSGIATDLQSVSCATVDDCVAVGYVGSPEIPVVRRTRNGGGTWTAGSVSGTGWLTGVDCPTAQVCYAAGGTGVGTSLVLVSTNGGQSWTRKNPPIPSTRGISCATPRSCVIVGHEGKAARTLDAGTSWQTASTNGSDLLVAVSCATASECAAVGSPYPANQPGRTYQTLSAGATGWSVSDTVTGVSLEGVSCPATRVCFTVGGLGTIRSTVADGWKTEQAPSTDALFEIDCPTAQTCWAVGDTGTIITNNPAEPCPAGEVGTPPACISPPGIVPPSNDCNVGAQSVAFDGYVGTLYARLRTKQEDGETWICTRLQPEGGQEYAGGKLTVGGASPVGVDSSAGACDDDPGGHVHVTGGELEGSPYSLDLWNDNNEAWVCVLAGGIGRRVTYDGTKVAPFEPDDPANAGASPVRTPWALGVSSADCEAQLTGTKTRLVNAVIGGVQVWVTGWQQGSKTMLCYRAEQGGTAEGGRLTVDATGVPGVTPILQTGSNTTGCTITTFSNDTAGVAVRRSGNNDNPASVCVTVGASTVRLTAGYTGTLTNPNVDFKRD